MSNNRMITIRLPNNEEGKSIHARLADLAEKTNSSVNQVCLQLFSGKKEEELCVQKAGRRGRRPYLSLPENTFELNKEIKT